MTGAAADDDEYHPRPLMGPVFWAALAFAALCVAGGVAVMLFATA